MGRKHFLLLLTLSVSLHACHYLSSEKSADKGKVRTENKRRKAQIAKVFHKHLPEVEEAARDKYYSQLVETYEAHQHSDKEELSDQLWNVVEEHNRLRADSYAQRVQQLQAREQTFFRSQLRFFKDMEKSLKSDNQKDSKKILDSLYKKHNIRQQHLVSRLGHFLEDSVAVAILKRLYDERKKPVNPKETMEIKMRKDNPKLLSTRQKSASKH